jgi:hypothetical protein
MLLKKNILILVKEKKNVIQFLSYNLLLNSGKKICASREKKNKYSNSLVFRKKDQYQKIY